MRRVFLFAAVAAAILGPWLAQRALALATEDKGNAPQSELNYARWKGIMPVVNDKSRVYLIWVNGNEHLFYKGSTEELNAALAHFAKAELKNRFVVLRPGPAMRNSFDKTPISYSWELHILGGLAGRIGRDQTDDLERYREPVLTVYVGGGIELDKLAIPKGLTLRAAPGKSEEARNGAAGQRRIEEFVEAHNRKR